MVKEKPNRDAIFCVADIVKRAKLELDFRTDAQLADYLGVSRSTLCNWIARNSIDFPLVLEKLKDIDYNWLLTGKGEPPPVRRYCDSELVQGDVELLHTPRCSQGMDDRSVTLYDITAAANLKTILEQGNQHVLGKIFVPNIPACDGAVYISGDSMYPILKSGDIVGFKFIYDLRDIIYGEMYLVSFNRGGDDYLAVKYVNRSDEEGCIRLVSYNEHHSPMDVRVSDISQMGIVKFSIRRHTMI